MPNLLIEFDQLFEGMKSISPVLYSSHWVGGNTVTMFNNHVEGGVMNSHHKEYMSLKTNVETPN